MRSGPTSEILWAQHWVGGSEAAFSKWKEGFVNRESGPECCSGAPVGLGLAPAQPGAWFPAGSFHHGYNSFDLEKINLFPIKIKMQLLIHTI